MANFQREKNVLRQLVKAQDAIIRKYRILNFGKDNAENILRETFKPIVDSLQELVSQQNKTIEHKTVEQSSVKQNDVLSVSSMIRYRMHETSFGTAGSDTEDDSDLYVKALKLNQPQYLDKIYGVQNENGKLFIGNLPISFYTNKIKVNGVAYPKTTGLL